MSCSSSSGSEEDDEGFDSYRKGGYHAVRVGDQFAGGRYIAQRKLGWGQFSTVWLAYDTTNSSYVALKIQKSAAQFVQAALHEIDVLSSIADGDPTNLKFVVQLIDHFKHTGPNGQHLCMVLEFLGDSLLRLIRYNHYKGLPLDKVREICKYILIGLDYLHRELGIIHTDLKPENILLFSTIDAAKDPFRSGLSPILERPEGNIKGGVTSLIEKRFKRRARRAAFIHRSINFSGLKMNWEKEGWCCFSKITKPHVPGLLSFQRNAVAKNNSPMIMSRRFGSKAINLGNEADHQLTREFLMKVWVADREMGNHPIEKQQRRLVGNGDLTWFSDSLYVAENDGGCEER